MSPELGFVLFLTLLWGPTAAWLVSRVLRGQRGRLTAFNSESGVAQGSELAPHEPESLTSEGFWVCSACHSMNRRLAKSCYSCRKEMHSEGRQAPEAVPAARGMVPVMADDLVRSAHGAPRTAAAPVASATADPVLKPIGRGHDPTVAVPPLEVLPADPVCPFLGFSVDPTTRCTFPDPRNRCHTPLEQGSDPVAFPLRLIITGKANAMRTLEIGPEHQEALCLTAAHEQCARFPAVRVVAASR